VRVDTGLDDGADGVDASADDDILDASEVDSASFICNGAVGQAGTVGEMGTEDATGAGCSATGAGSTPAGGLLLLSGTLGFLAIRRTRTLGKRV
jgi:hypothetical protein